tara:strand:+ start:4757 stop:5332 length:576 start_codon:yes stop_codon:yes gene_type:complete
MLPYVIMDFEQHLDKPKRKLTKKQLESLAEGRKKQKVKKEREIIKETRVRQRQERLERERVLNEQKEIEIYNKLMERGNKKIEEFKSIKYKYLEKATSIEEYNDLKQIVDQITEEDILTGEHIEKLKEGLEEFRILPTIEEEEELEEAVEAPVSPLSAPSHHENFVDSILESHNITLSVEDTADTADMRDI